MMLQMLQNSVAHRRRCESAKQQVQSFSETTDVRKLATELEEKLPDQ
jgi:hypothetical protein